ncbi:hypothetical protein CHS0354_037342 [Potamilus streckersoni]|uniref:Uncharacterized protein n=1 Tax=Potamilus streckersoni TaxID=2493646 RepID=A0AAE0RM84_9BIVA|nr:hypothetical protein CHS0354_037342 [Potamilus streckersoni]
MLMRRKKKNKLHRGTMARRIVSMQSKQMSTVRLVNNENKKKQHGRNMKQARDTIPSLARSSERGVVLTDASAWNMRAYDKHDDSSCDLKTKRQFRVKQKKEECPRDRRKEKFVTRGNSKCCFSPRPSHPKNLLHLSK